MLLRAGRRPRGAEHEKADAHIQAHDCPFSTAVAALLALQRGDALAVAGRAKLSSWEKNGEQKHGLSVTAERVLSPYMLDKKRQAARDAAEVPA